eukprot:950412-Pelagomonas_calceolata.AAC.1
MALLSQSVWFCSVCCNSMTLRKVLQADRAPSIIPGVNHWTSEVLTAFEGLQRSELYGQSACNGTNGLDSVEPRGHNHKRTTYHHWFAPPLNPVSAEAAPYKISKLWNWEDIDQQAEQSNHLAEGQNPIRALVKTPLNFRYQDQARATASNPPDPH